MTATAGICLIYFYYFILAVVLFQAGRTATVCDVLFGASVSSRSAPFAICGRVGFMFIFVCFEALCFSPNSLSADSSLIAFRLWRNGARRCLGCIEYRGDQGIRILGSRFDFLLQSL